MMVGKELGSARNLCVGLPVSQVVVENQPSGVRIVDNTRFLAGILR